MGRKVFRSGNSIVVSLPNDVLEPLGMTAGSEVDIALDRENHQIVIRPVELSLSDAGVDATFAQQLADFIEKYRPALEALAK